jgi:hypothetical protein
MRGIERGTPHFERTARQSKPTEQLNPHHEGGNGSLGLPRTVHESAKPPPESPAYEGRQSTSVQQPQAESEAAPAKRPRGRPRFEEVQLQFSHEALRYEELSSFYERLRLTSVQEPQPEGEPVPAQPKRKRGRPKLSEFSEEERLQRRKDRFWRSTRRELHNEMKQLRAVLSAKEIRDVKRLGQYTREGAKQQISRWAEDSVEITIWPGQKARE